LLTVSWRRTCFLLSSFASFFIEISSSASTFVNVMWGKVSCLRFYPLHQSGPSLIRANPPASPFYLVSSLAHSIPTYDLGPIEIFFDYQLDDNTDWFLFLGFYHLLFPLSSFSAFSSVWEYYALMKDCPIQALISPHLFRRFFVFSSLATYPTFSGPIHPPCDVSSYAFFTSQWSAQPAPF